MDETFRANQTVYTLGGLLVGASAINASLISAGSDVTGWMAGSVAFSLVAAILGLVAIYPRKGKFIKPERIREVFDSKDPLVAAKWLNEGLVEQLLDHAPKVQDRWKLISGGLIVLAAAIVCALAPIAVELVVG